MILRTRSTAFLGHSFDPDDFFVVRTFKEVLQTAHWSVVTGEKAAATRVSEKVRTRIADAALFVAIFTRRHRITDGHWTTSPWVIEEKAYSFGTAPQRPIILLVELGIPVPGETGGLHGDLEFIPFHRPRLDTAVRLLRQMLRSIEAPLPAR